MLATLLYLLLAVGVFAALGAPALARRHPGGRATVAECVVAGVRTLTRLDERRRSVLLPTRDGTR